MNGCDCECLLEVVRLTDGQYGTAHLGVVKQCRKGIFQIFAKWCNMLLLKFKSVESLYCKVFADQFTACNCNFVLLTYVYWYFEWPMLVLKSCLYNYLMIKLFRPGVLFCCKFVRSDHSEVKYLFVKKNRQKLHKLL